MPSQLSEGVTRLFLPYSNSSRSEKDSLYTRLSNACQFIWEIRADIGQGFLNRFNQGDTVPQRLTSGDNGRRQCNSLPVARYFCHWR